MEKIKPLLAVKMDLEKIKYPVLCTPKLDGIRCLMVNGIAMSRTMKPIRNKYVQKCLKDLCGLDGELMVKGDFNNVQSAIMKEDGEPDFEYHVFDSFEHEIKGEVFFKDQEYSLRVVNTSYIIELLKDYRPMIKSVKTTKVNNEEDLLNLLEEYLEQGYEGLMARDPKGKYKHGRSTVNEGILLKLKKFHDDEGQIIEVLEAHINNNEKEKDELGYTKRSSAKENMVPAGTLGAFIMQWNGVQFKVGIGKGITAEMKKEMWEKREELVGKLATFKYQELSKDGIPRFGKFVGIRHEDDILTDEDDELFL